LAKEWPQAAERGKAVIRSAEPLRHRAFLQTSGHIQAVRLGNDRDVYYTGQITADSPSYVGMLHGRQHASCSKGASFPHRNSCQFVTVKFSVTSRPGRYWGRRGSVS
jgi:hypothetical protein